MSEEWFQIDRDFDKGTKHIASGWTEYIGIDIDAYSLPYDLDRFVTVVEVVTYRDAHGYKSDYNWLRPEYMDNEEVLALIEKVEEMAIAELKK